MADLDPRISQAAAVAGRVELQSIALLNVRADLSDDLELSEFGAFSADLTTDAHHRLGEGWCSFVVSFRLIARGVRPVSEESADASGDPAEAPSEGRPDDVLYSLNATYGANYSLSEPAGLETEHFEAFGQVSAVFTTYPYARELIQTLTARAGLPPLTLGLVRSPLELLRAPEPEDSAAEE